jgi:hypothetical protein
MLVLMGMLLPSLVMARESARRANCASNLKQIGLSLRSYSIDSREWFPSPYPPATKSTDSLEDKKALDRLVEELYLTADKTYKCPSTQDETSIDADNHVADGSFLNVVDDIGAIPEGEAGSHTALSADQMGNHVNPEGNSKFGNILISDGRVQGYHGSSWWVDDSITESMRDFIAK